MVSEIIKGQISRVNRDLAGDPQLASCQVRRFLVLHKELDADDGELTRTRKVRRGFIAERYLPLIDALYSGAASAYIETEVTFEDRSEERRVGKECVSTCRSRWSPYH